MKNKQFIASYYYENGGRFGRRFSILTKLHNCTIIDLSIGGESIILWEDLTCPSCSELSEIHMEEIKKCKSCGKPIIDKFVFCPFCGEEIAPKCKHCGELIVDGALFCSKCGTRIDKKSAEIQVPPGNQTNVSEPQTTAHEAQNEPSNRNAVKKKRDILLTEF